ncbi:MAG TPA: FAD-dependent oxidoreductase [Candidatus Udaeobacter sp.]|jgi:2-polyprenyl-6-methoxyphenol hydroxylase-like FAD-dependent oxidoreductase|nr:FAD-dependent oxidoreductase [Candidatus Udaeobacter sp.]
MNGSEKLQTRCVIVGGGPAGMMAGYLLARAGVPVVVLEKHADFNRDFRGDTIHPSTLELMYELGLLDEFLKLPHQELRELRAVVNGQVVPVADFTKLPTRCKFIAFMPQWDFLNFLSSHAKRFPTFQLYMETEVVDLLMKDSRVTGVRAKTPEGELEIHADLVIGADGRHSITQTRAHLEQLQFGVPIDALWMRISKKDGDPKQTLGFFQHGQLLVLLDRDDYWQCGFVIPKGQFEEIKVRGLKEFQEDIASFAGFLRDRVAELDDWSKIRLLTVQVNRLRDWCCEGLLCIGDSAHAMSPAGGVGINLAIQDAIATANLLAEKLLRGPVRVDDLRTVQARREWPTRLIQAMQIFIHRRVVTGRSPGDKKTSLPFVLRLLNWFPILRQLPARFIGLGPRPEHVRSPTAV